MAYCTSLFLNKLNKLIFSFTLYIIIDNYYYMLLRIMHKIFEVFLKYGELFEPGVPIEFKDEILWTSRGGLKLIKTLFRAVKEEMSEYTYVVSSEAKSDTDKYIEIIVNNFGLEQTDICKRIERRINKLRQFHFRSGGLTVHFDEVVEQIRMLRLRRIRIWDTCQSCLYTLETSGHNPRPAKIQRCRNRIMHKFSYYPSNYDCLGCVGCGRCITACPVNNELRLIIDKILEIQEKSGEKVSA